MQNLPLEIVDRIVYSLPGAPIYEWPPQRPPPLAPYATISTYFLEAVQRRTWRSLQINNEDPDQCARYLRGHRLSYLRQLSFAISLPAIDEAKAQRFERPAETEAVSQAIGFQLRRLFDMLHTAEPVAAQFDVPGILQWREANSQLSLRGIEHWSAAKEQDSVDEDEDCGLGDYRHLRSRITLPQANELPMLHSVRHLSFGTWKCRPDPNIQLVIAARMPNLVALDLTLDATELRYPGVLRKDRKSLADALVNYSEQTKQEENAADRPEWRDMQTFDVQLELITPSGCWYFLPKGEPGYGRPPRDPAEDPEDVPPVFTNDDPAGDGMDPCDRGAEDAYYFKLEDIGDVRIRNVPCDDTMEPLFEAWARTLACMPLLRSANLHFQVQTPNSETGDEEDMNMEDWEIVYEAPGHKGRPVVRVYGRDRAGRQALDLP
ncbi:hypothetical protein PG994_013925 [Apiospora phragmitis]|uniref:F-box domain-containing protein n=1 Tax=Apiospora phragmitis TaxID=2905665 RepID=A0ABR1T2W4_9PEZI